MDDIKVYVRGFSFIQIEKIVQLFDETGLGKIA